MTLSFFAERDSLAKAAETVARAAGKTAPWTGVRLAVEGDKLRLSSTDLDVGIATTLAVAGGTDGVVVVPARRFADMAKALREGAAAVEAEGAALTLRCGASRGSLPVMRADDFPALPEPLEGEMVDAGALRAALAKVAPAASKDQTRPILTGVLFEPAEGGLTLVATDSYRLHITRLSCGWHDSDPALVPALALRELLRLPATDALGVAANDSAVTFTAGETVLSARLIAGEFPNYGQLIVEPTHWLEADRAELAEAVARVDVAAGDAGTVVVAVDGGKARLSCAKESEIMADEVDVDWDGPATAVAFNAKFLSEALAAVDAGRVRLGFRDELKPVHVTAAPADGFLALLVPIRLS